MKRFNPYIADIVDALLICATIATMAGLIVSIGLSVYFAITL